MYAIALSATDTWSRDWWYQTVLPWVEPLATVAAFAAAFAAIVIASRAYHIERERDERWARAQRSAQAATVAAWFGDRVPGGFPGVWLRNASHVPVYSVTVTVFEDGVPFSTIEEPVVPPAQDPVSLMLPTEDIQRFLEAQKGASIGHQPRRRYLANIVFTDSFGIRWRRDIDGALTDLGQARTLGIAIGG